MRNRVVYFGIALFEKKNAICQRAEAIKKTIEKIGYETILVGVNPDIEWKAWRKKTTDKDTTYEVCYPQGINNWLKSLISDAGFIEILENIGLDIIKTVIMADYRYFPMRKVERFCGQNGINFVVDIQDWFLPFPLYSVKAHIKAIDNWLRLQVLYPRIERKICISRNFAKKYSNTKYIAVIPGTTDPNEKKWRRQNHQKPEADLVLVFAGQPGKHCEKERLDWVLRAIYELRDKYSIYIYIAGVDKKSFVNDNPELFGYIEQDGVFFLGRVSHETCIEYIGMADFSLVIRNKNKLSEYGFSTKISESLACGTPVIATDTSDIKEYICDGINGYMCECNYDSVKSKLEEACQLNAEVRSKMHKITRENNPLVYWNYTDLLEGVL